jgi:hypothetical protein
MTTQDLQIGWIIRPTFRERVNMIYFQILCLVSAFHALSICPIEKRKNVIHGAMAAILLTAIVAGGLYTNPSIITVWIALYPICYESLNGLLIFATPALLTLAVAIHIVKPPLFRSSSRCISELWIFCITTSTALLAGNLRALHATAADPLWRQMAFRAWRSGEVSLEAALYGLRARDNFHATEVIP